MTDEQYRKVERSFKHGDALVFKVGNRVFVSERVWKQRNGTVKMFGCNEINDTCFEPDGEYYGDTLPGLRTITLSDPYPDQENIVASVYYEHEVVQEHIIS